MKQRVNFPAWLFVVAILAQLTTVLLCGKLAWDQKNQPKAWALDSAEYYKTRYSQSDLNYFLYNSRNDHEKRLQKLDKTRQARHRHIDSLSGPALQSEIDRQYNSRHPDKAGAKANTTNGSSGPSGTEGQSGPNHAARRSPVSGFPTLFPVSGYYPTGGNNYEAEPTPAREDQRVTASPGSSGRLPEEVARSTVGKLASSNRSSSSRRSQDQVNGDYWALIRAQGYVYPDVAWAISAVETGYWSPTVTIMKNNNLFAFKVNSRKNYVGVGKGGYCIFADRRASLRDYGAYEQQVIDKYKLQSRRAYLAHIYKRFCPTPSYQHKIDLAFQNLAQIKSLT